NGNYDVVSLRLQQRSGRNPFAIGNQLSDEAARSAARNVDLSIRDYCAGRINNGNVNLPGGSLRHNYGERSQKQAEKSRDAAAICRQGLGVLLSELSPLPLSGTLHIKMISPCGCPQPPATRAPDVRVLRPARDPRAAGSVFPQCLLPG